MALNVEHITRSIINREPRWLYMLFVIGLAFLALRLLLDSSFKNTTLVYLATPFSISILIHVLIGRAPGASTLARYLNHLRDATIIMLATSAILFEGFICVVMFMPIYYFSVTLGFYFTWLLDKQQARGSGKLGVYGVPLIIAFVSLEGLVEPLTIERADEAHYAMVVSGDIPTLKARIAEPIVFDKKRHWFLSIFPMPTHGDNESLEPGDIHKIQFVYKRWFFTNTHEGELHLKIAEVGDDFIRTEIVRNTSYLASYMTIEGTEVRFEDLGDDQTRVSLTIKYQRVLDPYWYFGPLQHFAAEQSAKYLIETVIDRKPADV